MPLESGREFLGTPGPKQKRCAVILISMQEIARDLAIVPMMIAHAYRVGSAESWVLVDSGTPGNEKNIREAAETRFGPGTPSF